MKKTFLVVALILWTGIIIINSSDNGAISNQKSIQVVKMITDNSNSIDKNQYTKFDGRTTKQLNYIVRKSAHFFQYFVFAILITTLFTIDKSKQNRKVISIFFIILLAAVLDEFHQKYIPNRTSNTGDIMIDFAGGVLGYLSYKFIDFSSQVLVNKKR